MHVGRAALSSCMRAKSSRGAGGFCAAGAVHIGGYRAPESFQGLSAGGLSDDVYIRAEGSKSLGKSGWN